MILKVLVTMISLHAVSAIAAKNLSLKEVLNNSLQKNLDIQLSQSVKAEKKETVRKSAAVYDVNFKGSGTFNSSHTPSYTSLDGVGAAEELINDSSTYSFALSKKFATGTELEIPYTHTITTSNSTTVVYRTRHEPSLKVAIEHPLIKGFFLSAQQADQREAEANFSNEELKLHEKIIQTLEKAHNLFWDTFVAGRTLAVRELAFKSAKMRNDFVLDKQKLGRASYLDSIDSRASLLLAENSYLDAKNQKQNLLEKLFNHAFSQFPEEDVLLEHVDSADDLNQVLPTYAQIYATAQPRRTELQRANASLMLAELKVQAAWLNLFPSLDLKADTSYKGMDDSASGANSQISNREFQSWSAGVVVSHPLFMRASGSAYEIAKLKLAQEKIKVAQVERALELEIRAVIRDLSYGLARMRSLKMAVNAAKDKYDAQRERHRLGRINVSDLIDAEKDYSDSQVEKLKTVAAFEKAKFALSKVNDQVLKDFELAAE